MAVGHNTSHVAIFRVQSSEQTISGPTGCTMMNFGALELSRQVDMRPILKYIIWLRFGGIRK